MPVVDGSIGGVMRTGPFGWSRRWKASLKKFAERSETVSDCLKVTLSFWKGSLVNFSLQKKVHPKSQFLHSSQRINQAGMVCLFSQMLQY